MSRVRKSGTIVFDFEADLRAFFISRLNELSDYRDSGDGLEEVGRIYCEITMRQISKKPRVVHRASSLKCPQDLLPGFEEVLRKVEVGENLVPHLSKFVFDPKLVADKKKRDYLFYDWGVHHLHLNSLPHPRDARLVKRTGPLLIARVSDTDFYAIKIIDHGAWEDREILEILHAEWPGTMKGVQLNEIMKLEPPGFSEQDTKKLREAGVLIITTRDDGAVHGPLGGGQATDGSSIIVTLRNDSLRRGIRALADQIEQTRKDVILKAVKHGFVKNGVIILKLAIDLTGIYAVADGTNYPLAGVKMSTAWIM